MLKERPQPPEGYSLIDDGKVRKSDLVWDIDGKTWGHPRRNDYSCLGSNVVDYDATCRKAK